MSSYMRDRILSVVDVGDVLTAADIQQRMSTKYRTVPTNVEIGMLLKGDTRYKKSKVRVSGRTRNTMSANVYERVE